jgi:hypothetical protein
MNLLEELVERERFEQEGAGLQRLSPQVTAGGHDDDRDVAGPPIAKLSLAKLPSIHPGHHQIQEDEGGGRSELREPQGPLGVAGRDGVVPRVGQSVGQALGELGVVVDDEKERALVHDALGSSTLKVHPWPGSLSTEIVP